MSATTSAATAAAVSSTPSGCVEVLTRRSPPSSRSTRELERSGTPPPAGRGAGAAEGRSPRQSDVAAASAVIRA